MNRRDLMKWGVKLAGLAVAGVVAVPAIVSTLSPALRSSRGPAWRGVGPLAEFPEGKTVKSTVRLDDSGAADGFSERAVYVRRVAPEEFIVFSRACTDLGCPVTYDPGSEFFYCPCHGGIFNESGEPVAGPPARPLYRYATRLRDGVLEIDLTSVPPVA